MLVLFLSPCGASGEVESEILLAPCKIHSGADAEGLGNEVAETGSSGYGTFVELKIIQIVCEATRQKLLGFKKEGDVNTVTFCFHYNYD